MSDKWIQDAIKRPGAFTKKADKHDMTVKQFAEQVTSNPTKYNSRTVKQANLAKTLAGLHKNKKS